MKRIGAGAGMVGKALTVIATAIGVSASVAYAAVRILDLETRVYHDADISALRYEQAVESRIVRGMIECVLRDVPYENCPAVRADLDRRR